MVVSQDPFANYTDGFVVWIRKCYRDLKEILTKAATSDRFVLLGTAGIGKSVFTLFWICFRVTLGEKVVWRTSEDAWYLLDFSKEGPASVRRFQESAHELKSVLDNSEAWLILDGGQRGPLTYACHILVACLVKKENYNKFSKNQLVSLRYVPAWSEEGMRKFLDDFESLRGSYSHMHVPEKDEAMKSFEKLGGVPRYVLHSKKTAEALVRMETAVTYLSKESCLKFFTGIFEDAKMSDTLVHIFVKCEDKSYESRFFDFASPHVQVEFGKRFTRLSKVDVVDFLRSYSYKDAGSVYGYIFELVAHELMRRGGKFPMKKVGFEGAKLSDPEPDTLELSSSMTVVEFAKVQELVNQDTYYRPLNVNFESVDAVVYPRILLQFF
ncbi:hypothetical protein KC19_5G179600 [Ceratodon purpureus]|uniref:Crinkler (CRN) family protein n=1 Tax=Ceratodon purpureus TaxID=3225 RepID=A0A8T0I2T8_CERPU|nr:hypothetical protein KC19_5G179600 [Ceratodon purpureus]